VLPIRILVASPPFIAGGGDLTVSFDRYDAEGNLTERTDALGQAFTYGYDELNRPTKTVYPAVVTPFVRMQKIETTFDANNNVATVTETKSNVTDVTTNDYDDFDRLISSTQRGMTIGYDYDKNGNRTQVETINGSTDYTFDGRNRLATAQGSDGVSTYRYTPAGRVESVSYANGATSATSYWPSNRIKTITHTDRSGALIAHFDYEYDKNGNRTRQVEVQGTGSGTVPVPLVTDYRYDDLDRMSYYSVTGSSGIQATTYTFLGYNRKTEWTTQAGVTVISKSYSTDESDWLTSTIDRADPFHPVTISYDYDKNGNTLKKSDSRTPDAALEFSYDAANRLVQSRKGATLTGQYDYNAAGLRVRHYGSERGNIETFYDDGAVLEEYVTGAGGGFLAHYRYADRLLSLATPSGSQYYHLDALGSTVDLTDQSGSVQTRYTLDPWGEITHQVGTSVNRMVFTGQEHDEKTGLIYFGARYYDPDTARFTTQDSYLGEVGTPPSLHRYLYAYANPTVYVDLMGYERGMVPGFPVVKLSADQV
jgi:RHS repeat-associated protein